jgi:hypothetical protein
MGRTLRSIPFQEIYMAETPKKKAAPAPRKPRATKAKTAEPDGLATSTPEPKTAAANGMQKVAAKPSGPKIVSHEEIRVLAHRYWAERGHPHGNPEHDWFRAEQELRGKAS